MKHLKITTAELAEICGVSQGTVDRALNNRFDIKEETKNKILDTAKLYGWRKHIDNIEEPEIKGQIGIIVFNLNNEYFSELIMATETVLKKMGYCTVVMMTHYDKKTEIDCIRNMYNMGVEGIIICPINSGETFANYLNMFEIPIVAVGNRIDGIPCVGIDDFKAMRDITESVLAEGYSELYYFSPSLKYPCAYAQEERYKGFLDAVGEREHTLVTEISDIKERYDENTVIMCSTDYYAFRVYMKNRNVKITGFDNLESIEKYGIAIDTVDYSVEEIAREAVNRIICKNGSEHIVKHRVITLSQMSPDSKAAGSVSECRRES